MAQEVTAHIPSLQMTQKIMITKVLPAQKVKMGDSLQNMNLFIGTAEGRKPSQSLILGML